MAPTGRRNPPLNASERMPTLNDFNTILASSQVTDHTIADNSTTPQQGVEQQPGINEVPFSTDQTTLFGISKYYKSKITPHLQPGY